MDKILIRGGNPLKGTVQVRGAKNSVLPLMAASILAERFAKVPERNRPYYSHAQRFRILEIRNLLAWNARDTARTFLVCANTILNWEHSADPVSKTVGADITPVPPVRRAADVVQATIQVMARFRIGGPDLTAC